MPWVAILLVFVFLKENRKAQALWILVPFAILNLIWFLLKAGFGLPSEAIAIFDVFFSALISGMTINWLFAERIGNRNRFVTLILSVLVFLAVLVIALFTLGISKEAFGVAIFSVVSYATIFSAFVFSAFMCRKKFTSVRFSVWIAVWLFVSVPILFCIMILIQCLLMNNFSFFTQVILQVLLTGSIFSLICYAISAAYLSLVFNNKFWRKRFEAIFKIDTSLPKLQEEQPKQETLTEESSG